MRILVCGGRTFSDQKLVDSALDLLSPSAICHGGARGADTLAGRWAGKRSVYSLAFNADWDRYGNAAGPIRNRKMLQEFKPDLVLAFPGGAGTDNMIMQAREANVVVLRVAP